MALRGLAYGMFALFVVSGLVAATEPAQAWSDGMAGSSGAVPVHLRKCATGFNYCKVNIGGCGGCHGDWEAMKTQQSSEQPVIDRISAEIWLAGRSTNWEYTPSEPGRPSIYILDIYLYSKRPAGEYNRASFDLNVSGGRFELLPNEDVLRITGGMYQHQGSKNESYRVCNPQEPTQCQPYGYVKDDEKNWSGELTTTWSGANALTSKAGYQVKTPTGFHYRVKWIAPTRQEPRGVAFNIAYMIPDGDAYDDCVWKQCNSTLGYSDQNLWDWWSLLVGNGYGGRKILCEKGQREYDCYKRVVKFILPPSPPLNTNGTDGNGGDGDDEGGVSPGFAGEAWAGVLVAGVAFYRWRRRSS